MKTCISLSLCLCFFVGAFFYFPVEALSADRGRLKDYQNTDSANATTDLKFTLIFVGNGLTSDAIPTDFKTFKSSDGSILYETWIDFGRVERARDELRNLVKKSIKTIRRNPELDSQGQKVGERILLLRRESGDGETEAILSWTNGTKYQEIRSKSLENVIAFERAINKPK